VTALVALLSIALYPSTAHAYLDPRSGSMLLQIVLGLFAGGFVMIRAVWSRFFKAERPAESQDPNK
jgi:hypothetical protein